MPDRIQNLETDVKRLSIDLIGIPVLVFWGGLSLVPFGMLFTGDLATLRYWINIFFLVSGLWGALTAYFGSRLLMWTESRAAARLPKRVIIMSYASIWSVLYLAFFFSTR